MEDMYRSQFRLPHPLYEKLKTAADASGRSVNAELVQRLSMALENEISVNGSVRNATEAQLIQELLRRFEAGFEVTIRQVNKP